MSINDTARGERPNKSALDTYPKVQQSAMLQRDVDKFLAKPGAKIITYDFGVSFYTHKSYAIKVRGSFQ